MFAYIKGVVAMAQEGKLVVENNGIGYELLVSNSTLEKCQMIGKTQQLYTYFKVSDDGVVLYGFSDVSEKMMFLKLITVTGVGPKAALAILSGITITDLAICIATEDTAGLTRVKGIGKKTAERIILELKEKIGEGIPMTDKISAVVNVAGECGNEAITALMALGLSRAESVQSVNKAIALGAKKTEDIIAMALKSMS